MRRWIIGIGLLWLCALGPTMAAAASSVPPADAPSPAALRDLAQTLQDPDARARLIAEIDALAAASKAAEPVALPPPSTVLGRWLETLVAGVETLSRNAVETAGFIHDLPHLQSWIAAQIDDPVRQRRWYDLLTAGGIACGLGVLARGLARAALLRPMRRLGPGRSRAWGGRMILAIVRLLLDLVPVALFALVAYGVLPLLSPSRITNQIVVATIGATTILLALLALVRLLLAPEASANGWNYRAIRRFLALAVFGSVALEAMSALGLPASAHGILARLFGLVMVGLIAAAILRHRRAVAEWLRAGDRQETRARHDGHAVFGAVAALRRAGADVWHILLIFYVVVLYAIWALDIAGGTLFVLNGSLWTVVVLCAGWGASRLVGGLAAAPIDRTGHRHHGGPPNLRHRLSLYAPLAASAARVAIYLLVALGLTEAWGFGVIDWLTRPLGRKLAGSTVSIALILGLAALVWETAALAIERYLAEHDGDGVALHRSARARTLLPLLRNALAIVLIVFAVLTVLSQLGIDIAPLLAGAGVIGLALGFGAQTLVKDVITGLFILIEDTISIGDVVAVTGKSGVVEGISIRTIKLRDTDGALHTVPFSAVTTISNMTKGFGYAVATLAVAYETDPGRVIATLQEIDEELRADPDFHSVIRNPLEIWGTESLDGAAMGFTVRCKTRPGSQWAIKRELYRRIQQRFLTAGIALVSAQPVVQIQWPRPPAASPPGIDVESKLS